MRTPDAPLGRMVFRTDLGWMAMAGKDDVLWRLVFGYPSQEEAERALGPEWLDRSRLAAWNDRLRHRLQDYASGRFVEFDDVPVELDVRTDFGRRVFAALRTVRYGQVITYAALAAEAGSPKAARAVGNWMAANPIPLVVPCHRVVCSLKKFGAYSAPGGAALKRRLLEMER